MGSGSITHKFVQANLCCEYIQTVKSGSVYDKNHPYSSKPSINYNHVQTFEYFAKENIADYNLAFDMTQTIWDHKAYSMQNDMLNKSHITRDDIERYRMLINHHTEKMSMKDRRNYREYYSFNKSRYHAKRTHTHRNLPTLRA